MALGKIRGDRCAVLVAALCLAACGGGGGSSSQTSPPPPGLTQTRVSAATPFTSGCNGAAQTGQLYVNGPVEPQLAPNPANPQNLIGVWQQDRWSNGGAQGLMTSVSLDGGNTWSKPAAQPFSTCAGGNSANGGGYQRASDPWVTFSPDGVAYQSALAFDGDVLQPGSSGAVLVSRSADGGQTWSTPLALIQDGATAFNDKESITADSNNSSYVYAVWDRLTTGNTGPTYFTRSTDGGKTWQPAQAIYDPGVNNQTIGNQVVTLPGGGLVLVFTEIDQASNGTLTSHFSALRSGDQGSTWMLPPVVIAESLGVGAHDDKTGAPIRDGTGLPAVAAGANGQLALTWSDARFSNGNYDGIALSLSGDGGATWSAPVEINGDPSVQAFTPSVRIAADGTIGITYFDFRSDNSNPQNLLTDYWLTTSQNGSRWSERQLSGPFDLTGAPQDSGYFLGDYQALAATAADFVPLFAQVDAADGIPASIYAASLPLSAPTTAAMVRARALATPVAVSHDFAARVSDAIRHSLRDQEPPRRTRAVRQRR